MSVRDDEYLPSEEELTIDELKLSTAPLRAGAMHYGKHCEKANNEYLLCISENNDRRECLKEGRDVNSCAFEFFKMVKKTCYPEFTQYAQCLDKSSSHYDMNVCRKTQAVFDKCMEDNLSMSRPPYDYFVRWRIHDTKRPKPETPKIEYEPVPSINEEVEHPPAKYGDRFLWRW